MQQRRQSSLAGANNSCASSSCCFRVQVVSSQPLRGLFEQVVMSKCVTSDLHLVIRSQVTDLVTSSQIQYKKL